MFSYLVNLFITCSRKGNLLFDRSLQTLSFKLFWRVISVDWNNSVHFGFIFIHFHREFHVKSINDLGGFFLYTPRNHKTIRLSNASVLTLILQASFLFCQNNFSLCPVIQLRKMVQKVILFRLSYAPEKLCHLSVTSTS